MRRNFVSAGKRWGRRRARRGRARGRRGYSAYVSYYVSVAGGGVRHALPLGLASAAGAITFFAAIGAVIAALGGGIAPYLVGPKPFVALVIVGLGIVQVLANALRLRHVTLERVRRAVARES